MANILLSVTLLLSLSISWQVASRTHREVIARTGSMLPTIPINSTLIVDEEFYVAKEPRRFDIVAARRSFGNPDSSKENMNVVVRVIGLPSETVELHRGRVYINGRKIKEPFGVVQCPRKSDESFPCGEMPAMRIPTGEYFLLADNRAESEDSRLWSPRTIPKSDVLGKVIKVVIPTTAVQQPI